MILNWCTDPRTDRVVGLSNADTTTTGVEQGLLIAMKGLEDLAQAASQATGTTEGWTTAASRAETIANGLKTGEIYCTDLARRR